VHFRGLANIGTTVIALSVIAASCAYGGPAPDPVAVARAALTAAPSAGLTRWVAGFDAPPDAATLDRLAQSGARALHTFRLSPAVLFAVDTETRGAALAAIGATPGLRYLEPDAPVTLAAVPNDPLWPSQWGLHQTAPGGAAPPVDIDAPEAWDVVSATPDVVIALVDTGVDLAHPDLAGAAWTNTAEAAGLPGVDDDANGYVDDVHGYNFREHSDELYRDAAEDWHGTHLAGILAARADDGLGVAGLASGARLMVCKFIGGPKVSGTSAGAAEAIEYAAAQGAHLINASFGTPLASTLLADTIAASGLLVAVAAGNDRRDIDIKPSYPASLELPNVITVAAVDAQGALATGWGETKLQGSNWGLVAVDLAAPGDRIRSTWPDARWGGTSGTSMATPLVTATAALLLSWDPSLSVAELRAALLASARPLPALAGKVATGGLLSARGALDAIGATSQFSPPTLSLTAVDAVDWQLQSATATYPFTPQTPPPGGATEPFLGSLAVRARAFAGPSGGTVTVALMTPGQPPRVLWRAVLPPGAELPDAMRCAGPPSPTCVLAPDAGLGVGPFTIALRATGDAGVQVSQVRYVWRAEVAP
jgi:subtilisin family serine protease